MIQEEFLHYIWQYSLYENEYLFYRGNPVRVIHPGVYNSGSGPDFSNARIWIGDTLWAGNVEIHNRASDWFRHRHEDDPAYESIILHLVYDPDRAVYRKNGEEIPFVRLSFHPGILEKYQELVEAGGNPLCHRFFGQSDKLFYHDWIGKLGAGRLERRVKEVENLLKANMYDWDQVLYSLLAKAFGSNVNAQPFFMLSHAVPLRFVYKNRENAFSLNAAFYGQAGFLDEALSDDSYYLSLQREYRIISRVLPEPLPGKYLWKRMRLRPPAYPVVRIAQFIFLVRHLFPFFEALLKIESVSELLGRLESSLKYYQGEHFLYRLPGRKAAFLPGKESLESWIINAVIPLLFTWGRMRNAMKITDRAISFLEQIAAENNEIIKKWNKFGVIAQNAFESQALIELKNRYCMQRNCTQCMIGHKILQDARTANKP